MTKSTFGFFFDSLCFQLQTSNCNLLNTPELQLHLTMDFKGISWAGNIYEKFETMCLEVEEVMYEDTVKYVENQVQKVGVSVKKFYSEVMQDLIPPSYVDPVKSSGNFSLSPSADMKKTKLGVSDGERELKKKDNDESYIRINDGVKHKVLVENTGPKLCSTKNKLGIQKRPIGIKRISQNSRPVKVSTHVVSHASEIIPFVESQREWKDSSERTSPVSNKILSVEHHRSKINDSDCKSPASEEKMLDEFVTQKKEDMKCTSPASEEIVHDDSKRENIDNFESSSPAVDVISSETARQKKCDSGCTSSCCSLALECTTPNLKSISMSVSRARSNTCEDKSTVTPNEDASVKDISFYQLHSNSSSCICNVENADDFEMEVIENEDISNPNLDILDPVEKLKLEESCVFVEGNVFHYDQGIKKQKSYKKKIREALSSKLRSPMKHDQLMDSNKRNKAVRESLESDWELL